MRGIWSWGATATSIATTAKGNFATSLSGIDVSPLEYVPASRSPVRSRERSDRVGAGVWLSLGLPAAEKSRSEEHTSELQSRLHLVCRLLLEKKKKRLNDSATVNLTKTLHCSETTHC